MSLVSSLVVEELEMRVVFFLGAGFSRSAGFPLMREFSMFSQNMVGFEEHILCLHACIEYAQRTRAYIHGDIYNVEYLMSVLSLAAITNPNLEFTVKKRSIRVSDALEKLKQLVWRVYSQINIEYSSLEGIYTHFMRSLHMFSSGRSNIIDIITTNYDLLPEMVMITIGHQPTMPDDFVSISPPDPVFIDTESITQEPPYKIYDKTGKKNLHKLHGSVNWFVKKRTKGTQVACYDQAALRESSPRLKYIPLATGKNVTIPDGYVPVIVPPSMIKEYNIPVIKKAWQDASSAIAKADKIIFIGYSFPPSDTIMKFFLGTSLANNRSGCRITIIDKYADDVMKSLNDIFVEDLCKHHIEAMNSEFKNFLKGGYFTIFSEFVSYLKA